MSAEPQALAPENEDQRHLRWLSIAYYAHAGLNAAFGLLGLTVILGVAWLVDYALRDSGQDAEAVRPFLLAAVALAILFFTLVGAVFVVLNLRCARYLKDRERYSFCMGLSGFYCAGMPIGTVLGVCSLLVLTRASVRARFFPEGITEEGLNRLYFRLLSIGYTWVGVFLLLQLMVMALGIAAAIMEEGSKQAVGELMITVTLMGFLGVVWAVLGFLMFFTARYLKAETHMTFCRVVAAVSCLFFGYGTALGALTLLLLAQPSAQRLFVARDRQAA